MTIWILRINIKFQRELYKRNTEGEKFYINIFKLTVLHMLQNLFGSQLSHIRFDIVKDYFINWYKFWEDNWKQNCWVKYNLLFSKIY